MAKLKLSERDKWFILSALDSNLLLIKIAQIDSKNQKDINDYKELRNVIETLIIKLKAIV